MCPEFETKRGESVVGSRINTERFFSGYSGFPLLLKKHLSNSNSTRNGGQGTAKWMCYE